MEWIHVENAGVKAGQTRGDGDLKQGCNVQAGEKERLYDGWMW